MEIVISDNRNVREDITKHSGVESSHYRDITEEESLMYNKAIKFVDDNGVNELARLHIVETDENYDETNIDAEFSCLIIDTEEETYHIELSEKYYPVQHIRVIWDKYTEEFELH